MFKKRLRKLTMKSIYARGSYQLSKITTAYCSTRLVSKVSRNGFFLESVHQSLSFVAQ